jgi:DNA-binding transcriptional LysR family regulator
MLDLLSTLQAVSRYGTFAAAGMRLGITQSAVSMQIKKLEAQLGYAVLDRSGRKALINDAGRKVLAHMQQIDALLAQLRQGIVDEDVTGLLRVGSISTSLLSDIPDALAHLRIKMPKLELHLTPGTSPELLLAVEDGRLDAALLVRPSHPTEGDLFWQTLRQEPFVLIAPKHAGKSSTPQLLATSPFIRYDRNSYGGGLVDRYLKRRRIKVRDHVEVDSIEAIALMVSGGQGVAIVPNTPCLRRIKLDLAYLGLGEDGLYRSVGLVARSDGARLHLVRQFWQALQLPAVLVA